MTFKPGDILVLARDSADALIEYCWIVTEDTGKRLRARLFDEQCEYSLIAHRFRLASPEEIAIIIAKKVAR